MNVKRTYFKFLCRPRWYFEYMTEGGGVAGCSAAVVHAAVVQAADFTSACKVFYDRHKDNFYGAFPDLQSAEMIRDWMLKRPNYTVHGAFRLPPEDDALSGEKVWKKYENVDVWDFKGCFL